MMNKVVLCETIGEECRISRICRSIALLLTILAMALQLAVPAFASSSLKLETYTPSSERSTVKLEPTERKTLSLESAAQTEPAETQPEQTVPEETAAQETQPEETVPEETTVQETQPEETVPEETVPEETLPPVTEPVIQPVGREYPHYFQNDYPDVLYGNGTIASSGCGIVSLAMVASYMTGHQYWPDELAGYFGFYKDNNTDRLLYAADQLQLPWHMAENWHEVYTALQAGNPVIVLVSGESKFTDGQHFLVLTGVTEDGRILVLDSIRGNYDRWDLKHGYENGFSDLEICAGYSGAWIFEMENMPEEPFIYWEAPAVAVEQRYLGLQLTEEEEDLLARMVWVEARGESLEGQQAVAEVVLNRLMAPDYPNTVKDVIYADGQFRSTAFLEDATPTQAQYKAIDNALNGPYILPTTVIHFATYPVNNLVWGKIGGHTFCHRWSETEPAA